MVRAVSPVIENKLIYLRHGETVVAARAGGEIPSRAAAVGAGLRVLAGAWRDGPEDSAWIAPTAEQLYHELDRFHLPPVTDSSWAEWHYFNLTSGPGEWWYLTWLVGGEVPNGRWGGRLLVSHRRPDGTYQQYSATLAPDSVVLDTTRADLILGSSSVRQRDGVYHLSARAHGPAGSFRADLEVRPDRNRYFPPVDLKEGVYLSGYVVPMLSGRANGRICLDGTCRQVNAAPAYHDHNWGVWRDVTWDWGAARGKEFNLLYGAVYAPEDTLFAGSGGSPRIFVALVDSLGVRQILRARRISYTGVHRDSDRRGVRGPAGFEFVAAREGDTLWVKASILDFHPTARAAGRQFLQMRGSFTVVGGIGGKAVADSGAGFFETYVPE
jgi:hypothetical protein